MNNRLIRVLTNKSFLFLFLAEVFSQVAMNVMNFILLIVAFELTGSNAAVSGIVLSFTIPAIFLGVLAGAYVDRWNKRKVLFLTNITRAVFLCFLAFLSSDLLALYVLSFVIAIITQFFIPAETPMIPLTVKKDQLLSANALFGMGIYGSILIAYALSGPFLTVFGSKYVFLVLAILFLIASVCVSFIKLSKKEEEKEKEKEIEMGHIAVIRDVKNALSAMHKTKVIYRSLFLLTLSQVLILIIGVIGPGYARQILKVPIDQFPLLFVTPAAFGMVVGAVVLDHFFHRASKEKCATIGVFLSGLAMLLLPYGSQVTSRGFVQGLNASLPPFLDINIIHIMTILAFILGLANALVFVPSNTIIQEETTDEFRGKMYGVLNSLVGIFSLFPIIIVGSLADIFGVGSVVTGIGITILAIAFWRIVFK